MNTLGSVTGAVRVRMGMLDAAPVPAGVLRVMGRLLVADGLVSSRRVVDLPADTVLAYFFAASDRAAQPIEGRTR